MQGWLYDYVYRRGFMRKYPYYASILARMMPIEDPTVDVMGVSRHGSRFYLHINVDFFVQEPEFVSGVLLHEVHHIVLGHLTSARFYDVSFPNIMELAMEVSANEYIQETLPGQPITWQDFRPQGLRPDQSTLERYALLVEHATQGFRLARVSGPWVDDHHRLGVGSIYGTEIPSPGADELTRRLIRDAIEQMERERAHAPPTGNAGLLAGRDPGRLIEELAGLDEPADQLPDAVMDWKAAIQMFAGLVRAPVHTFARPNRRFRDRVGEIPGRIYYPSLAQKPKLVVAIDTSASMSTAELKAIARELRTLHGLTKITIVECDAEIQRVYPFEGELGSVAGRGGTDLRPVFAPEFLAAHRTDGVIYFTDGLGPYPEEAPRTKTLWILSKPSQFGCPWGKKAYFPDMGDDGPPPGS